MACFVYQGLGNPGLRNTGCSREVEIQGHRKHGKLRAGQGQKKTGVTNAPVKAPCAKNLRSATPRDGEVRHGVTSGVSC